MKHTLSLRTALLAAAGLLSALTCLPSAPAHAASGDIVPQGSTLLDAFAVLAKHDDFVGTAYTTNDFLAQRPWSRGELAQILERTLLTDPPALDRALRGAGSAGALRAAAVELRDELTRDGYDAGRLIKAAAPVRAPAYDLTGKLEGRSDYGLRNSATDAGLHSGLYGIYRGAAQGNLGGGVRYAVSVSNYAEDARRYFDNDIGPHDFAALQEAYVEVDGNKGLRLSVGRMYDRWGSGYRGATLFSDNSSPFDQLELSFPFSLGRALGHDWAYDQFAGTFEEAGNHDYVEGRRVTYTFTKQYQADISEAFKSNDSTTLLYTPIPFDVGQGIRLATAQYRFNYQLNLGFTYSPAVTSRAYGSLLIDDIKGPFSDGHLAGLNLGNHDYIPQKLAYIVGGHTELRSGTAFTAEYDHADDGTYTYRNGNAVWQHGSFNWIGLPAGPDSQEFYSRIDQRLGKPVTLGLEFRDRWRKDTTYIGPTARELGALASYQLGQEDSVGLEFYNYRQDPYPYVVGAPGSPTLITYAPASEGDFGQRIRANEFDFSFTHTL